MDAKLEEPLLAADGPPFVTDVTRGTMSGAETLAYWRENEVFDVPWPQFDEIGEGKRFRDSSEYARHLRGHSQRRDHE